MIFTPEQIESFHSRLNCPHYSLARAKLVLADVCRGLREAGVETVTLTYNGSGDEGFIDEITFDPCLSLDEGSGNLTAFLEDWAFQTLSLARGGWEINDGGWGEITIDVAAATAHFDHNDNEMTSHGNPFDVE